MNNIQFRTDYSTLISPSGTQQTPQTAKKTGGDSPFGKMLRQAEANSGADLTFSKHAMQRLDARQIQVSPQLVEKMSDAVDKAESKGVTEALILNGSTAFIVNVPNRTVVTTMNGGEMTQNIFTNIDGAVIL